MFEVATQDDNVLISAGLGIFAIILIYLIVFNQGSKKKPPGPYSYPVIGNLSLLTKGNVLQTFRDLRLKYGDLFSLRLGRYDAVVVNGYDTMKELLAKRGDEVSYRPDTFVFKEIALGQGIVGSSGLLWKTHRTFALTTLRSFGFGKRSIENRIMEEVDVFLQAIESKNGEAFDLDGFVQPSISNIICSIIFGKRFEYTDKQFIKLLGLFNENMRLVGPSAVISFFPFLKYIPGDPFGGRRVLANMSEVVDFIDELITEHNQSYDEDNVRDYIDAYLKEMKNNKSMFTDTQLNRSVVDLFVAGTETTATAIKWAILYFLHYPDVQSKMRQELDDIVGTSRPPSLSDRSNLPYCEAVITEVLRCGNITPLSVQHSCRADVSFKKFIIPKGALIIPNLDSVLSDSTVFENADKFNPTRFIDENGKFTVNEKMVPFSLGRRVCLGESLARSELFLYLTSIVQRFECVPENKENIPTLDATVGITRTPNLYKCCALKRS